MALLVACGPTPTEPPTEAPTEPPTEPPTEAPTEPPVEPVTVTLWFHSGRGEERDALNQILANFAAARDDIVVDAVELPEGSYNEQVQAAAFSDDLPCLLDFDGPFVYNYVWGGFMLPLDDYISDEMRSDFLPSILEQGTYQDGKLYSLGQFDSGLAIWANKAYLEAAGVRIPTLDEPWTREEFEAALAALQALPEVDYALDMKMNYGRGEWFTYGFSPILQSFGGDLINRTDYQSADGVLNGPESVAAMEMVQSWFEMGYVNPEPAGDTDFVDGKAALSWVGHWVAPGYMEALGDNLLLLPMPDFGNGPKTGMGSWNWGITTNCENPDAAWEVLEFILQPEQILVMTNANGAVPARKSALAMSDLYGPDGFLNLYVQQLEAGVAVPRPVTPAYPVITSAFAEAFDNIKDGADVQTEMDRAVEKIDQDIQDNQGYPINP
ncbi:MAG TPA: sugar ABC transporter substrate-binding protein [Anaerolineales bacterium]|nr:sugar ABC transporter substrate-binding protein [Anaerolineae bacterium]HIQ02089.1 sugar ABC transporter substrate-binding protein [Anaerolineales bacterium]